MFSFRKKHAILKDFMFMNVVQNQPLEKKDFIFMNVLYVCMCTTCRPGAAHRYQKRKSESQELDSRMTMSHHLGCGNSCPLEEQKVLLTTEVTLQS